MTIKTEQSRHLLAPDRGSGKDQSHKFKYQPSHDDERKCNWESEGQQAEWEHREYIEVALWHMLRINGLGLPIQPVEMGGFVFSFVFTKPSAFPLLEASAFANFSFDLRC